MNGLGQAARVSLAAEAALEAVGDTDPAADDLDRRDLARLLAAVGSAWNAAERRSVSLAERLRWSAVCAIANRIALRWEDEADLAEHSESIERGEFDGDMSETLLAFLRDVNRKSP